MGAGGDQARATAPFLNPEPSPPGLHFFAQETAGYQDGLTSAQTLLALRAEACRRPVLVITEKSYKKALTNIQRR